MSKLNRKNLKKLIIKEMQKLMDEEALMKKNDYIGYGMLNKHDDPGRQMMYTACSECGTKMNEDEAVCEQCGAMYENELTEGHCDDPKIGNHKTYSGSYMAKSQLYKINKYAEKLYHMIPEGHNLEDWMRTKISQIADDIGEVYHALDHDKFEGDI